MSHKVLPYNAASLSSKELARSLGVRRLRLSRSRYIPRRGDVCINWGNASSYAEHIHRNFVSAGGYFLNTPARVNTAGNKLLTFRNLVQSIPEHVPPFTTQIEEAESWLREDGCTVVARHRLRGHSGQGVQLISPEVDSFPEAPLYVKYIKKQYEYRVHVVDGVVIDTQRKMRRSDVPDDAVNWQVRNFSNGFTYGRGDVHECFARDALAVSSVQSLELDFGAVDIIYNAARDKYYVLEVNTAPGLVGTTLDNYTMAFRNLLE